MIELNLNFLNSENWKKLYSAAEQAVKDYKMYELFSHGVVVGFSGGADSVTLLLFLNEYRKRNGYFPLSALHVNHMIRGKEADRDEEFSRQICESLNVDFFSVKVNVPELAKSSGRGLEDAARAARYAEFRKFLEARDEYNTVATAHNSTDNLETVIFNMLRGAGIDGLSGISPVRDNIVRPLMYVSGLEIREFLKEATVPFVVDSTNASNDYTRNYIRHEIVPRLSRLNDNPERIVSRVCRNLRDDADFIDSAAEKFLENNYVDGFVSVFEMSTLHKSLLFRVLTRMVLRYYEKRDLASASSYSLPERTHLDVIGSKLSAGDFAYCLPGGVSFVSKGGRCFIAATENSLLPKEEIPSVELSLGLNKIKGYSTVVLISETDDLTCYSNVYKIAIQKAIPFDIIKGSLYLRSRQFGDSYRYGGATHKVKKLFVDRKIPQELRLDVPLFLDELGIVWIPGYSHREGETLTERKLFVTLLEPIEADANEKQLYFKLN